MKAQQDQVEALLPDEGWRLVTREEASEWWLDELWILESSWSPVGVRAVLSFLVDPQAPIERRQGEHVWAVAVMTHRPSQQRDATPVVPIRPRWEKNSRDELMALLRGIREAHTKEGLSNNALQLTRSARQAPDRGPRS